MSFRAAFALCITAGWMGVAPLSAQAIAPATVASCGPPGVTTVASAANTPVVGVQYFAGGSTRGDDPQLAEAVTADVVRHLSRAAGVTVVRGDQWLHGTAAPAYVLTGHVSRVRDQLSVRVRLNEARSGSMVWSSEVSRPVLEMPVLSAQIAAAAAGHVGGTPDSASVAPISVSLAALDQLLLGEYNLARWDQHSMERAGQALATGAGLSGGDPMAYARYGSALGKMGEWGYRGHAPADSLLAWASLTSELAGRRAAEVDSRSEAAASFGQAASFAALRGDTARARRLARQSDSLERGHPDAVRTLALLELPGNPQAAAARLRAAPNALHGTLLVDQAMLALTARRDEEACRILNAAVAEDPRSAPAFALRSLVRLRNGDIRGGWADAEMARQLGRSFWGDALDLLAAARVSERQELLPRVERFVRNVRADSSELSVLDAQLAVIALTSVGRETEARAVLARMRYTDPRRELTLGEATPQD